MPASNDDYSPLAHFDSIFSSKDVESSARLRKLRQLYAPKSLAPGHIHLWRAIDRLRPILFAGEVEAALSAMELAWIKNGPPGAPKDCSSILPGRITFTSTGGGVLLPPHPANPDYEAAIVRKTRLDLQTNACEEWLVNRGLVSDLPDGPAVVSEDAFATALEKWQRRMKRPSAAANPSMSPPLATQSDRPTPKEFLVGYAAEAMKNGFKAKRDSALSACASATGCTYRTALAAWNALDPSVKRKSRETDRALTGR